MMNIGFKFTNLGVNKNLQTNASSRVLPKRELNVFPDLITFSGQQNNFFDLRETIPKIEGVRGSQVSDEYVDFVAEQMLDIPEALRKEVSDFGYTFVLNQTLTDGFPTVKYVYPSSRVDKYLDKFYEEIKTGVMNLFDLMTLKVQKSDEPFYSDRIFKTLEVARPEALTSMSNNPEPNKIPLEQIVQT